MKAIHKYNPHSREGARRIAQSMGYKMTIHDMPHLIALFKRAGIEIETHEPIESTMPTAPIAETTTLKL